MFIDSKFQKDIAIKPSDINSDFISLFNKPGPYYSSYPTLSEWKKSKDGITKSVKMISVLVRVD